jgi:hypothetical protein
MQKLRPFRQYDEQDVLGIFSLDVSSLRVSKYTALAPDDKSFKNGANWSGTAVSAKAGNALGGDEPLRQNDPYLGAIGSGNQGPFALQQGSFYPEAPLKVEAASDCDGFLGITLRPTMAWDENMEKLLYYPVKKDEFQAVLPGETVPVATRGFFTLTYGATATDGVGLVAASKPVVGSHICSGANGQFVLSGDEVTEGAHDAGSIAGTPTPYVGTVHQHYSDQRVAGIVLAEGKNGGDNVVLVQLGIR